MIRSLFLIFVFLISTLPAYGLERFDIITTEQLHEMIEERNQGKEIFSSSTHSTGLYIVITPFLAQ